MNDPKRYDILIDSNENGDIVVQIEADGKRLKNRAAISAFCDFVIQNSDKTGYEKALDMTAFFYDGETRFKVEKKFDVPPHTPVDVIASLMTGKISFLK